MKATCLVFTENLKKAPPEFLLPSKYESIIKFGEVDCCVKNINIKESLYLISGGTGHRGGVAKVARTLAVSGGCETASHIWQEAKGWMAVLHCFTPFSKFRTLALSMAFSTLGRSSYLSYFSFKTMSLDTARDLPQKIQNSIMCRNKIYIVEKHLVNSEMLLASSVF